MGLFDHFPYTNVHELNLDWVLSMMKALEAEWDQFTAGNSLTFADPMLHDISKTYAKNTIILDSNGNAYVSLQAVPVGVGLQNGDYWLMVFDYEAFIEKINKNFTSRYYRGSYRATAAMALGDWLTVDDVLYKATDAIAVDDVLEAGVNIEHFTLEDFIKAFMYSANQLIQQYKNDIDASELLYRQQLAGDIQNTTASLQAQLDAAIAGVTVDSEVINARVGQNYETYATLKDALDGQFLEAKAGFGALGNNTPIEFERGSIDGNDGSNNNYSYQSRVRTVNIIRLPYDITFSTSGAIKFKAIQYNADGSHVGDYSNWVSSVTIPAGIAFRLLAMSTASPAETDFRNILNLIQYDYKNYGQIEELAKGFSWYGVKEPFVFVHGSIDSTDGSDNDYNYSHRIRSNNIMMFPSDIIIRSTGNDGAFFIVLLYHADGTYDSMAGSSLTYYKIEANTPFRLVIQNSTNTDTAAILRTVNYYLQGDAERFIFNESGNLILDWIEIGSINSLTGDNVSYQDASRARLSVAMSTNADISIEAIEDGINNPQFLVVYYNADGSFNHASSWSKKLNINANSIFRAVFTCDNTGVLTATTEEIAKMFRVTRLTSKTAYIASDGDDNGAGCDYEPWQTIQRAIDAGFTNIHIKAGFYQQNISAVNLPDLSIVCDSDDVDNTMFSDAVRVNKAIITDAYPIENLAAHNSIERAPITLSSNERYYKVFIDHSLPVIYTAADYYGHDDTYNAILWEVGDSIDKCYRMTPVLTLTDCENTPCSFYCDSSYIYIHSSDDVYNDKSFLRPQYDAPTHITANIYNVKKVYLKNVEIDFGSRGNLYLRHCEDFTVENCNFLATSYDACVGTSYSSGTFINCKSAQAASDGFGIGVGVINLINCSGRYCWDDGVSHHQGSEGFIDGGEWAYNLSGGITPAFGARVDIRNAYTHHNEDGIYYIGQAGYQTSDLCMVYDCVSVDNSQYDIHNDLYNLLLKGNTYHSKASTGTLTEYTSDVI